MGLFSSKKTTTENFSGQSARTVDPDYMAKWNAQLGAFDNLTSGVLGQYAPKQTTPQYQSMMPQFAGYGPDGMPIFNTPALDNPEPAAPTGPTSFIPDFSQGTQEYLDWAGGFNGSGDILRGIAGGINPGKVGPTTAADIAAVDPIAAQEADFKTGAEYMSLYRDPYTGEVVNTALADYDTGVDRGANQMRMRRDAGSAFGDRAAIADAVFQGDAARGRGSLSANLRSQAFNTAAQLGMQDATRYGQTSQFNAGQRQGAASTNAALEAARRAQVAGFQQNTGQFNAGLEADNYQRGLNAAGLQAGILSDADLADLNAGEVRRGAGATVDEFNAARAREPLDLMLLRSGILGDMPYNETTNTSGTGTTTTKKSGGLGSMILGGLFDLGGAYLGRMQ